MTYCIEHPMCGSSLDSWAKCRRAYELQLRQSGQAECRMQDHRWDRLRSVWLRELLSQPSVCITNAKQSFEITMTAFVVRHIFLLIPSLRPSPPK